MAGQSNNDSRTLLRTIDQIRNGRGYRRDIVLQNGAGFNADGTSLATVAASNMLNVAWAASDDTARVWQFPMPGDFATETRELSIGADIIGGLNDTVTMTCTIYAKAVGGVVKGPFTSSVAMTPGATVSEELVFDFTNAVDSQGRKLDPRDTITVRLTPSTHDNDDLTLYSLRGTIRSNLALTDMTARSGDI